MLSKTLEMIVMTHDNIKIFIEAADHLNANQSVENFLNKYRTLTSFLSSLNIKESQTKRDIILRHIVETAQRLVVERTYYLDMVEFHNYISTLNKFIEEETKKKYK